MVLTYVGFTSMRPIGASQSARRSPRSTTWSLGHPDSGSWWFLLVAPSYTVNAKSSFRTTLKPWLVGIYRAVVRDFVHPQEICFLPVVNLVKRDPGVRSKHIRPFIRIRVNVDTTCLRCILSDVRMSLIVVRDKTQKQHVHETLLHAVNAGKLETDSYALGLFTRFVQEPRTSLTPKPL